MLALEEVGVVRDGRALLTDVSVVFGPSRCTAVVGPSGSGKSTLLRLLDRLADPTSGRVLLDGEDLRSLDVLALRRRIGLVQQVPVVLGATIREDVATGCPVTDDEADALLVRVGLAGMPLDRATSTLSGGEAQRLCLARALAVGPEVLLMDEPTSALDSVAAHAVEHVVRGLVDERLTVVLVSHDLAQARRLAHDVVVLRDGRVVETGHADVSPYLGGAR